MDFEKMLQKAEKAAAAAAERAADPVLREYKSFAAAADAPRQMDRAAADAAFRAATLAAFIQHKGGNVETLRANVKQRENQKAAEKIARLAKKDAKVRAAAEEASASIPTIPAL